MKLLHTSDLHLGLRLCETPMNEEIAVLLDEIVDIAEREGCSAVIVAGDIYDRSNPGADSVAIFDRFVTTLSEKNISVLAVSGNHDSPERVAYMSELLRRMGVHFSPVYDGKIEPVVLNDESGEVYFWLIPFLRPSTLRALHEDFTGDTYTDAMGFVTEQIAADKSKRNVIVTHQFVVGSKASETENVGGIMAVDSAVFDGFCYTALGHLHTAHNAGNERVRYSGSPLKCSFSEANDRKTVDIVEINSDGSIDLHRADLHPAHDMREIRGTYEEVISPEFRKIGREDDYIRIVLTDEEDVQDAVAKLRIVYPNLLRLAYDNRRTREYRTVDIVSEEAEDALNPENVFAELYELQNNVAPDSEIMETVRKIIKEIRNEEGI